jgi:hypothetical protein
MKREVASGSRIFFHPLDSGKGSNDPNDYALGYTVLFQIVPTRAEVSHPSQGGAETEAIQNRSR